MLFYNKKIGIYKSYYNTTFISYLKAYNLFTNNIFSNKLYKNHIWHCVVIYPILYKKMSFFRFSCNIVNKKKMKSNSNLNQTVILEGFLSRNKCFFSIPVFSFVHNIKGY